MERTTAFRVPYKRGRRKNEPHLLVSSRGPSPRSGPWSQLRQQSGKGVSKLRPEKQERPASSLCWPWKNLLPKSVLGATLADRLQAGDAQFPKFLFSCRILNLALFLLFCLRFAGGRTGDRY